MSDDDAELKDVLIRSLNDNGILTKLKAQLRAAAFLALEKHNYQDGLPPPNEQIRSLHASEDGLLILSLVAEFLECTNLTSSLEIFLHEAQLTQLPLLNRSDILSRLGLVPEVSNSVLSSLVSANRGNNHLKDSSTNGNHTPTRASPAQVPSAPERGDAAASVGPPNSGSQTPSTLLPNGNSNEVVSNHLNGLSGSDSSASSSVSEPPAPSRQSDSSRASSNLQSNPTSRNRSRNDGTSSARRESDYQDDFDCLQSPDPRQTLSSRGETESKHSSSPNEAHTAETNHRPANGAARTITPSPCSDRSPHEGRSSTMSPVIRVYTKSSRRPQADDVSDVDECDDEEEENIPEILKEYDVSEDSEPDRTIDSDESLGLDHVEAVQPRAPKLSAAVRNSSG